LTGRQPQYLRHELTGNAGDTSAASPEPLWWPPAKIAGHYLGPFLGAFAGTESTPEASAPAGSIRIDVDLERESVERMATLRLDLERKADGEEAPTASDVMSTDPIVVAPDGTLGELAERMRERNTRSALVAEDGRLIGILTARDLLAALAGRVDPNQARVHEWMTAEPVAIPAATPIELAVTLMTEYGVHHLPVVDDERPVGLLSLKQAAERTTTGIGLGF
jgi:CBS domain-containing protein